MTQKDFADLFAGLIMKLWPRVPDNAPTRERLFSIFRGWDYTLDETRAGIFSYATTMESSSPNWHECAKHIQGQRPAYDEPDAERAATIKALRTKYERQLRNAPLSDAEIWGRFVDANRKERTTATDWIEEEIAACGGLDPYPSRRNWNVFSEIARKRFGRELVKTVERL